jgi:hypothetical protein
VAYALTHDHDQTMPCYIICQVQSRLEYYYHAHVNHTTMEYVVVLICVSGMSVWLY